MEISAELLGYAWLGFFFLNLIFVIAAYRRNWTNLAYVFYKEMHIILVVCSVPLAAPIIQGIKKLKEKPKLTPILKGKSLICPACGNVLYTFRVKPKRHISGKTTCSKCAKPYIFINSKLR